MLMAFAFASYRDIAAMATMQVKIQHCAPSFWSYTWGKMHMANNEMHHAKMKAGLIQRNPGVDWAPQKVALVKLHGRPAAMNVDDDSRRHGPTDDRRHGPTDDSSRRHGPTGTGRGTNCADQRCVPDAEVLVRACATCPKLGDVARSQRDRPVDAAYSGRMRVAHGKGVQFLVLP